MSPEGHFCLCQLNHKFSILNGERGVSEMGAWDPHASVDLGTAVPLHSLQIPTSDIPALEFELLMHSYLCFCNGSVGVLPEVGVKSASQRPPFSERNLTFTVCKDICLASRGLLLSLSHPSHQHSSMKKGCHQAQLLIHNRSAMCDCLWIFQCFM